MPLVWHAGLACGLGLFVSFGVLSRRAPLSSDRRHLKIAMQARLVARASFALSLACVLHAFVLPVSAATAEDEAAAPRPEPETLDLTPSDQANWSFRYVYTPLGVLVRGRAHFYAPRVIEIDTTPSGGYVDLFYVRSGFQKRFEQAEAPVRVVLPSRIDAGPRDSLTIRAFAEGYRQQTRRIKVRGPVDEVLIDLSPLPNLLEAVGHRYFAGRSSLTFFTNEALSFRVQQTDDGVALILNQTALSKQARASVEDVHSPLIDESHAQQLGEDLMIRLTLSDRGQNLAELRSRQDYDAPRDLHAFILDLAPSDGGADMVGRAQSALAALDTSAISGCRLTFDDRLRGQLDPGELARALSPRGAFVDPYIRAAMRRLGELSVDGVVDFEDGTRFRPTVPIELEMALTQPGGALGFLALLDAFVRSLEAEEAQSDALRGLLAPELDPTSFRVALDVARDHEDECREGR